MAKIIGAGYVPVIHRGYLDFIRRIAELGAEDFVVFGDNLLSGFDWKRKDIRAIPPEDAAFLIRSLGIFRSVSVAEAFIGLPPDASYFMPEEEVSRKIAEAFSIRATFSSVFLRWDSVKVSADVVPTCRMTSDASFLEAMKQAELAAALSSDWWRHVGAALIAPCSEMIVAHNRHLPSEHTPYILGDSRMFFKRGVSIEMTTAIHAEAAVISEAARRGVATNGAIICVTTYPCPACAKLIAQAGVRTLVFKDGYSVLDAESSLKDAGVMVFRLDPS